MYVIIAVIAVLGGLALIFGYLIDFKFELGAPKVSPRKNIPVMKGCESFEFGEGDRACLVLHGIAGSPAQLKKMSRKLADEGIHLFGPRLPGHGTDHEELYGITWREWYDFAEAEFLRLKAKYSRVDIIGFSLGAALGVLLAAKHEVNRLVLMSAPVYLFHSFLPTPWILRLGMLFANSARTFPRRLPPSDDMPDYLIYRRVPFDALWSIVELVQENKRVMPDVKCPTLLLHSRCDIACKPRSARYAARHLGSENLKLVWLDRAPHGMTHGSDKDKALIHKEITDFLLTGR